MLRDSIQSVLDDEILSYVGLATATLHDVQKDTRSSTITENCCYVCLGGTRIRFFERDLSDEWESDLYLSYDRCWALISFFNNTDAESCL